MELKRIISGIDGAINSDIFAPHKPKKISSWREMTEINNRRGE
ncbi:hypothetical protein [Eudoraea sp.]